MLRDHLKDACKKALDDLQIPLYSLMKQLTSHQKSAILYKLYLTIILRTRVGYEMIDSQ